MGNYLCEDSSCEWHDKLNRQGACEYADNGATRCPSWRCDCFIETHPDSPMGLHPEDFMVSLGDLSPIPHYHYTKFIRKVKHDSAAQNPRN